MAEASDDSRSLKAARTRSMCRTVSTETRSCPPFVGRLQPTTVRQRTHPDVCFNKGGSDFRCLQTFSSFGRQTLSRDIYRTAAIPSFTRQERFYVPGDKFKVHGGTAISSLGKQPTSTRKSAGRAHFGTSTRDNAMKMYALWSVGQQR